jgi:hypothetical protein
MVGLLAFVVNGVGILEASVPRRRPATDISAKRYWQRALRRLTCIRSLPDGAVTTVGATESDISEQPAISRCFRREVQPGRAASRPEILAAKALVTAAWLDIRLEKRC